MRYRASPSTCYAQNVLVRAAEMAVAASYTPWTFSAATTRVGWGENADGELTYDPLASCDTSLFSQQIRGEAAAGGESSALLRLGQAAARATQTLCC